MSFLSSSVYSSFFLSPLQFQTCSPLINKSTSNASWRGGYVIFTKSSNIPAFSTTCQEVMLSNLIFRHSPQHAKRLCFSTFLILDWPSRCATMQLDTTSPLLSRQARSMRTMIGLLMTCGTNTATAPSGSPHQQFSHTSVSESLLAKVFPTEDSRRRENETTLYCMLYVH